MRQGGVRHFISYWGAPISGINRGPKLWLKKLEVALRDHGPDHYIFESEGMAETATYGRGIAQRHVSIVYLGVNTDVFKPQAADSGYVYQTLQIPSDRKIFFFSGHMERRKGVHILIDAVRKLVERGRHDFHLLILGNRPGEAEHFAPLLVGAHAEHITFGGYRNDLPLLHRGCFAGLIGSTGWDSLTCSAIEMTASGLPLIVSNLSGLRETVDEGVTGFTFPAGDSTALSRRMLELMNNPELAATLGQAARQRAQEQFSLEQQQRQLLAVFDRL
jgi:glycosyltransferase involved in cell wall biosynthesis